MRFSINRSPCRFIAISGASMSAVTAEQSPFRQSVYLFSRVSRTARFESAFRGDYRCELRSLERLRLSTHISSNRYLQWLERLDEWNTGNRFEIELPELANKPVHTFTVAMSEVKRKKEQPTQMKV